MNLVVISGKVPIEPKQEQIIGIKEIKSHNKEQETEIVIVDDNICSVKRAEGKSRLIMSF